MEFSGPAVGYNRRIRPRHFGEEMRRSPVLVGGFLAAALLAAGCDNGPDTAPTPPTVNPVTETFSGTINLNGATTHAFTQTAAGTVTATITAIVPSEGSVLGFQLGTWDTVRCTVVLSNDLATTGSVLSANTQSSASLCIRLHDPNGVLTDRSVQYTVTVTHR
jgi:hypothetical protein